MDKVFFLDAWPLEWTNDVSREALVGRTLSFFVPTRVVGKGAPRTKRFVEKARQAGVYLVPQGSKVVHPRTSGRFTEKHWYVPFFVRSKVVVDHNNTREE